jgi:putative type II restriction endonuclease
MNDGAGASASPVYNFFVDISKRLSPKHMSLIMPARWFAGGRGVDEFRKTMLADKQLSLIHDYFDARACFSNVEIKGGIMYFRWDKGYYGNCHVVSHTPNGTVSIADRPLVMTGMDSFIRHNEAVSIVEKVRKKTMATFDSIVSSRDPFGLDIRATGTYIQVKPKFSLSRNKVTDVAYYYFGWRKDGVGYLDIDKVNEGLSLIEKPKLFIPCAWGNGRIGEDRLKPFIPEHRSVCFETYLMVGPFDTWAEVENAEKYINTKFFHLLVAPLKISQHATQSVYRLVPLQNFTSSSDIDWNKAITEIDQQLYIKYSLTDEEIAFIESMIKPM